MAFDFWIFKFLDCCRSINNGGTSEDLKTTHLTHPWRVLWAAYVQETTAWGDFVCASHAPMLVHTKVACCWAKAANGGNAKGRGRCKRRSCAHLPAVQFTGSCIDCCMLCVCVCVCLPPSLQHTPPSPRTPSLASWGICQYQTTGACWNCILEMRGEMCSGWLVAGKCV